MNVTVVRQADERPLVTLEMTADEALTVALAFDAATAMAELAAKVTDRPIPPRRLADTARDLRIAASMLP